ncbi:hypothetical protein [uncultured Microscilla sp.]|uniref:hypothetical protein n=1 Tax=uncultured Microscilla sp. TaxID=432653 RepID=UPI002605F9D1|nr:hypothetical protein [uncultured Microscilla sp.]
MKKLVFTLLFLGTYALLTAQPSADKAQPFAGAPLTTPSMLDADYIARVMAALPLPEAAPENIKQLAKVASVQNHYKEFAIAWQKLESKKLSRLRKWRDSEITNLHKKQTNLFYPFAGPDFLNAYLLFPTCDNYLLFGLEKMGTLPTMAQLRGNYLFRLRKSLSILMKRNYFITRDMINNLNSNVKGVLPLVAVFMARTDNKILSIQKVYVQKNGKPKFVAFNDNKWYPGIKGVTIEFKNKNRDLPQRMYYFGTNFVNTAMYTKKNLVNFITNFKNKMTFTKSASYLLHGHNFSIIRNIILNQTSASVQDDTGVPYRYFKNNWSVKLYGKYARPVRDFNYGFQTDLNRLFKTDKTVKPIDFTFGYHWWTDKSSILVFRKK